MRLLLIFAMLAQSIFFGQNGQRSGGGSSNIFTLVASTVVDFVSCSSSTCSVTIPSTGTGHLLFLSTGVDGTLDGITAVTGGGTWVVPAGCKTSTPGPGETSCAYVLSSSSGATTLTVTTSNASAFTYYFRYVEFSFTLGSTSLDTCNSVVQTANTTQPGVALTLSGSSDAIIQSENTTSGVQATSVSGGYSPVGFPGHTEVQAAYLLNTAVGTAPNWTLNGSAALVGGACAFR